MTRFGCVGFSMYACGFSVHQMLQFCLLTCPPRSKWASSERMIFFAKIGIFCKSIAIPFPSIVQAYTQPYLFGGRIKQVICQIRHELSVTIHEISTNWKNTLDGGPYTLTCLYIVYWVQCAASVFEDSDCFKCIPTVKAWSNRSKSSRTRMVIVQLINLKNLVILYKVVSTMKILEKAGKGI